MKKILYERISDKNASNVFHRFLDVFRIIWMTLKRCLTVYDKKKLLLLAVLHSKSSERSLSKNFHSIDTVVEKTGSSFMSMTSRYKQ